MKKIKKYQRYTVGVLKSGNEIGNLIVGAAIRSYWPKQKLLEGHGLRGRAHCFVPLLSCLSGARTDYGNKQAH